MNVTLLIIIGILGGVILTMFAVFAFFLVRWIRELASVAQQASLLMRRFLEDPVFSTGFKNFKELSEVGQSMHKMMKELNETIIMFYRMAMNNQVVTMSPSAAPPVPPAAIPPDRQGSDVYFYDETAARLREDQAKLKGSGINLTEEPVLNKEQAVGDNV